MKNGPIQNLQQSELCRLPMLPPSCDHQGSGVRCVILPCGCVMSDQAACSFQPAQPHSCNCLYGRRAVASWLHCSAEPTQLLSTWLCTIAAQLAGKLPIYQKLACRQQARQLGSPRRQLPIAEGAESSSVQPSGPVLAPAGCPALLD